jgi:molybdopterin converting factor small subunit
MRVPVRLAEPFWRAVGQREIELTLPDGARVADLLAHLCQRHPALKAELVEAPPVIFIGEEEADENSDLREGCRVHIVWPVAGGYGL